MNRIALPLLLAVSILPLSVHGGASFDFEAAEFPVSALSNPLVEADVVGAAKATLVQRERNGKSETVARVDAEGVLLKGDDASIRGESSSLTISTAILLDEVVSTPIFFQRIDGSIGRSGYLSFHGQLSQGDPGKRTGTFRLAFTNDEGGQTVVSSKSWNLHAGEWVSVAVVFDHGKVRFYLNGERVGDPVDAPANLLPGVQGRRPALRAGRGFTGEIDDLVILPNRALDDQQIKALHQEGTRSEAVRAFLK